MLGSWGGGTCVALVLCKTKQAPKTGPETPGDFSEAEAFNAVPVP
jgi:hypothetical protein